MAARDEEYQRKRQQIIDAALAVFSEKGFEKATNQEIAKAAGIGSPGLIYHYFDSKADLLRQAVASRAPMLQTLLRDEVLMPLELREALRLIGSVFLSAISDPGNRRLFRVILAEALRDPATAEAWHRSSSWPAKAALLRYLRVKMQTGALRPVDPEAAANCFLGPYMILVMSGEVFGRTDAQRLDRDAIVNTTVEIFLRGLEAV
jgi:AcrR family transcriptional regulator